MRKPLRGERMGETAKELLAGARCPVWLVPAQPPESEDVAGAVILWPGGLRLAPPLSGRGIPSTGYGRMEAGAAD